MVLLTQLIDMLNNLLLEVLNTMAELDRIRIKTTQSEGRASKNRGVKFGRPTAVAPAGFEAEVAKWRAKLERIKNEH